MKRVTLSVIALLVLLTACSGASQTMAPVGGELNAGGGDAATATTAASDTTDGGTNTDPGQPAYLRRREGR